MSALLDSCSQGSFITKETASQMGYEPAGQQSMHHVLFGRDQTSVVMYNKYLIHVSSVDDT